MTEAGPRVTEDDIRRFEQEIGHELPEDYRKFLAEVNGGQPSLARAVFRLRKGRSILNSLLSLHAPDDRDDLATAQRYPAYPKNDLPEDALTIGYDASGSRIVLILAGEHRGEVWFLDLADPRPTGSNPRVDWFSRRDVVRLAGSFRELVESLGPLEDDSGASASP